MSEATIEALVAEGRITTTRTAPTVVEGIKDRYLSTQGDDEEE